MVGGFFVCFVLFSWWNNLSLLPDRLKQDHWPDSEEKLHFWPPSQVKCSRIYTEKDVKIRTKAS